MNHKVRENQDTFYSIWRTNRNHTSSTLNYEMICSSIREMENCIIEMRSVFPETTYPRTRNVVDALDDDKDIYIRWSNSGTNEIVTSTEKYSGKSITRRYDVVFEEVVEDSIGPATQGTCRIDSTEPFKGTEIIIAQTTPFITTQKTQGHVIEATFTGSGERRRPARPGRSGCRGIAIAIGGRQTGDSEGDQREEEAA